MKKILLYILLVLFITSPVYAKENRLYFTNSGDRIYYESKLIDEDVFMKHVDMVPGSKYTDELIIENGTKTKYTLFFKVQPREQSELADELLENINMTIYLDDELVYEGKATGLDYEGINLRNAINLGEFDEAKKSKMIVYTNLDEKYSNTDNNEFSYIDWQFYAQYDKSEPTQIVEIPDTNKDSFPIITVISIIFIIIGLGILYYARKVKEN